MKFQVDDYAQKYSLSIPEAMRQYFRDDVFQAFEGSRPPEWYDAIRKNERKYKRELLLQLKPYRDVILDALRAEPTSFDKEIQIFDQERGFPNRPKQI